MSQPLLMKTSRETRAMAGEPPATIRVNNIQAFYEGPQDAWGRPDRPQPVSASVEVFLAKPFSLSSSQDVIEADTVHYGQLSKVIIALLDPSQIEPEDHPSLVSVVYKLWSGLSGIPFLDDISGTPNTGFLKAGSFRYLSVSLKLPKASLVGDGVSITYSAYMRDDLQGHPYSAMAVMSSVLKIHDLRVPTLIGINANERQARQTVIANIEIDNWLVYEDVYCSIEAVVVKVWLPGMTPYFSWLLAIIY